MLQEVSIRHGYVREQAFLDPEEAIGVARSVHDQEALRKLANVVSS
jgi:hypothetical protein